jgi:alkanesulfonate monooxygenase SsuD/methylene tetrahydromethanopterin reductase-like flavin-dependent oxidoreductase (luciferase family)
MRLGVSLAQTGRLADPAALRSAATAAEQVGYSSVWVADRLDPAPGPDPVARGRPTVLDPVAVLGYAAACTTAMRLGTNVVVTPDHPPGRLARSLWSLDVVSDGRLIIGLGSTSAAGLDTALDAFDRTWSESAPERVRPPVLISTTSPDALTRVARRSDGWNPADLPADLLAGMWTRVRDLAADAGRDPDALHLVVRATIDLRDEPIDGDRAPYAGTDEQVAADIEDTRRAGANEIVLDVRCDDCLDEALGIYARLAETYEVAHAA